MLETLLPMLPRPEIEIDQIDFREWLDARRSSVVGVSCEDGSCPVSRYLTEQYQQRYYVSSEVCGTSDAPASYDLPWWVRAFVNRLDFVSSFEERSITGAQALQVYNWAVSPDRLHLFDDEVEDTIINDEYCWTHTPGGWTCSVCRKVVQ